MSVVIKRLLCIISILAMVVYGIDSLGFFLSPFESNDGIVAVKAFHQLPENSLDAIVIGSSHAWRGFDTRILCDEYGVSAYNYGCHWQHSNTSLLFLQDALTIQSPKVVLFETFRVDPVMDTNLTGEIYYTRAIQNGEAKREYLQQCFAGKIDRYISYYVPLTVFHSNWANIDKSYFYSERSVAGLLSTRGFLESEAVAENISLKRPEDCEQNELDVSCRAVLDKYVELCRENNIQLIFYTVPYVGEYKYFEAMEKYAAEKQCVYLNLFDIIDPVTDFQDLTHLNSNGSAKVARFIGNYIKNNLDL